MNIGADRHLENANINNVRTNYIHFLTTGQSGTLAVAGHKDSTSSDTMWQSHIVIVCSDRLRKADLWSNGKCEHTSGRHNKLLDNISRIFSPRKCNLHSKYTHRSLFEGNLGRDQKSSVFSNIFCAKTKFHVNLVKFFQHFLQIYVQPQNQALSPLPLLFSEI